MIRAHARRDRTTKGLLCALAFGLVATPAEHPPDTTAVVAEVNGAQIRCGDVQVPLADAQFRFKLTHGHEPQSEVEVRAVEQLQVELEQRRLAEKLHRTIYEGQRKRLGVDASAAEVATRWGELTKSADPEAAAAKQKAMLSRVLDALTRVYQQGENSDVVYERLLAHDITKQEWEVHLHYFNTVRRRQILEKQIAKSASEFTKPDAGIRALIVQEKMQNAIDREIARVDPTFARYLELSKTDPKNVWLSRLPSDYAEAKRHEWWVQRYRESNIRIREPRYRDALRFLIGDSNVPRGGGATPTSGH